MDSRDINIEVPRKSELGYFHDIMVLQLNLLDKYIGIESLPKYPLEINLGKSQVFLKDFSARVVEELGEAYESYDIMLAMFKRGLEGGQMVNHLQNFNEELSDSLHFFLELLVYSGIEEAFIKSVLYSSFPELPQDSDTLRLLVSISDDLLERDYKNKIFPGYPVIREEELTDIFYLGGRKLSPELGEEFAKKFWDVTYKLQIARNLLKNKPWKQSQMITDVRKYRLTVIEAFILLIKAFRFFGHNEDSIFNIYFKKNQVNLFRIQSKY